MQQVSQITILVFCISGNASKKQVWTKNSLKYKIDSLLFYKFYQQLANSNATKEALKCTASIAADSIVDAISFITGILFCDRKQVSAKFGFGRIWVPKFGHIRLRPFSQIRCNPSSNIMNYRHILIPRAGSICDLLKTRLFVGRSSNIKHHVRWLADAFARCAIFLRAGIITSSHVGNFVGWNAADLALLQSHIYVQYTLQLS